MSTITKATVLDFCGNLLLQNWRNPLKLSDREHFYLTIMYITLDAYTFIRN